MNNIDYVGVQCSIVTTLHIKNIGLCIYIHKIHIFIIAHTYTHRVYKMQISSEGQTFLHTSLNFLYLKLFELSQLELLVPLWASTVLCPP